ELKDGARPIDLSAGIAVSPCDGIVGATGPIVRGLALQAKDSAYTLGELLRDRTLASDFDDGWYVTLRLTSTMYHRFHAPYDCDVRALHYISGDVWNVNPPALQRVARLFCRNERAVVPLGLRGVSGALVLVPVGAVLVGSIHFNFVERDLKLTYRGPER